MKSNISDTKNQHNQVVGKVIKLFISQANNSSRVLKKNLSLDSAGVLTDKFYNKDTNRSVLISSNESYNIALNHNISMEDGALGENILIDYNPYHLPVETQIQIGEVILEITQNCTLCKSLTKVNNKLPKILKDDRGIFAKVVTSGYIYIGDEITIL